MGKRMVWVSLFLVSVFVIVGCAPGGVTKDFSADSVAKFGGQRMSGKIYFAGDKWRFEGTREGQKFITIVRTDKNVMWMLMPSQKMYMQFKVDPDQLLGKTDKMPGEIERKKVASETVNGIPCDKYKVAYKLTEKAKPMSAYLWLSRDKIAVKSAAIDGSWSSEYKNIKRGKQPASLFELPAGYKKFEIPKMPAY